MDMSITGIIKEYNIFGPNLELRRTISATLGQAEIRIKDEVINRGNTPVPLMILYHFNFGFPLVDEGTKILWEGAWEPRFGNENTARQSRSPPAPTPPQPPRTSMGAAKTHPTPTATPQ